jgi:hypothetical protein
MYLNNNKLINKTHIKHEEERRLNKHKQLDLREKMVQTPSNNDKKRLDDSNLQHFDNAALTIDKDPVQTVLYEIQRYANENSLSSQA